MKRLCISSLVVLLVGLALVPGLAASPVNAQTVLRIDAPQNLYAHIWRELDLSDANHIELEARMKVDSAAGWVWAPGIHLVWGPSRTHERLVHLMNGAFNIVSGNLDKPVYPVNTWVFVKLEVTESEVIHWVKAEEGDWEAIARHELASSQKETPPSAVGVGKGASAYGTLMRSHASPGKPSVGLFDYVILRVDGETVINENFAGDLSNWEVRFDERAPGTPIRIETL